MTGGTDGPTLALCREEVQRLTTCFAEWYTGQLDDIEPIADALAPEFELVGGHDDRTGREATLDAFRQSFDVHDASVYALSVENVSVVHSGPDHALVRYDEFETAPDGNTHRVCTALLVPDTDAPTGLSWVTIQETTLDETGGMGPIPGFEPPPTFGEGDGR